MIFEHAKKKQKWRHCDDSYKMTSILIWSKFLYHSVTDRKQVIVESPPFPVKATFSLNFKYCKNDSIDNSLLGPSAFLIGHLNNAWVSATNNESFILLKVRVCLRYGREKLAYWPDNEWLKFNN